MNTIEISKGIFAYNKFIYLEKYKSIIISDIHIGYEETLIRSGVFIPKNNFKNMMLNIISTLKYFEYKGIEQIILNGDIVHDFSKLGIDEKNDFKILINELRKFSKNAKITIIEGNHDKLFKHLLPYMDSNIELREYVEFSDIRITHGDKKIDNKNIFKKKVTIIGHIHPAITVGTKIRKEKYKCFVVFKNLIIMPSSSTLIEGKDIISEASYKKNSKFKNPYLQENIDEARIFIISEEILDFGKIKDLKKKGIIE